MGINFSAQKNAGLAEDVSWCFGKLATVSGYPVRGDSDKATIKNSFSQKTVYKAERLPFTKL